MPHERFFFKGPLLLNEKITLDNEEERHLKVMRMREGDTVEIINGQGDLAKALLEKSLYITEVMHEEECKNKIIIVQGIPRSNRLDFILEKGTELGMDELWLFPAEYSEKKEISDNLLKRLNAIAIAATKQCGRLYLPQIKVIPPLKNLHELPFPAFFGDVEKEAPAFHKIWKKEGSLLFFVGPERGFSPKEEELLKSLHAQGIKLHPHILRTDTAPIAFLSIVHHLSL